jgi:dTDP-4-amino-4,6-dideoxygalactose transaminase
MQRQFEKIAALTAETFGRRRAVLTGRGAGAVAIALKALLKPGDRVAVPSICCLSPVNVVSSVGMQPVICDCDPLDLNISPRSVKAALDAGCRAVIAVHIFGKPCHISEIAALCRDHDAILIDDACQAAGTIIDGRPAGGFGDAGIMSFGEGKIIPGVDGGGAVMVDDDSLHADLLSLAENLPEKQPAIDVRSQLHRDIATAIQNAARPRPSLAPAYEFARDAFLDIFEYKLSAEAAKKIEGGLLALPAETAARRERSMKYRSRLGHPLMAHIPLDKGQSVFRHTFTVGPEGDGGRRARWVVDELRANGIHASQHYFPTHLLMPRYALPDEYMCAEPAMRALNLWVDDCADDDYIERSVHIINKALVTDEEDE